MIDNRHYFNENKTKCTIHNVVLVKATVSIIHNGGSYTNDGPYPFARRKVFEGCFSRFFSAKFAKINTCDSCAIIYKHYVDSLWKN